MNYQPMLSLKYLRHRYYVFGQLETKEKLGQPNGDKFFINLYRFNWISSPKILLCIMSTNYGVYIRKL